ncbi:MAG: porin [Bryobacterales bacterium]|nr:porin [Bryobacteraceae bacterium]MDW8354594.1 porin [Bryobacterales bacterium]
MRASKCVSTVALLALLCFPAEAQTTGTADAGGSNPAGNGDGSREWSVGPIRFSGLIDGYYSLNFNHPASRTNQLRNFDVKANQFSLNMAKLVMEHSPDPLGFRVDLGFGRAFDIVHGAEAGPEIFRNIQQAFLSYKPAKAKGLQLDFGKFVTNAGAEVIETHSNWNYSRSLLFAWAIPYYHFGVRASMPLGNYFSAGISLVNGWNNVEDNNSGKTVGLTGTITTSKFTWTHNYYFGPEKMDVNQGYRHLYDTTMLLTPHPNASFYLNFDYGIDKAARVIHGGAPLDFQKSRWVGVAGAARFAVSKWFAVAPRLEWFHDADGFSTGTAQKLKEFTLTGEFKMAQGVLTRLEYRRDWSDQPFFDRGVTPGAFKHQDTLLAGFVAYFGPER